MKTQPQDLSTRHHVLSSLPTSKYQLDHPYLNGHTNNFQEKTSLARSRRFSAALPRKDLALLSIYQLDTICHHHFHEVSTNWTTVISTTMLIASKKRITLARSRRFRQHYHQSTNRHQVSAPLHGTTLLHRTPLPLSKQTDRCSPTSTPVDHT